jgi:uncharacterized caspase-like protein
VVGVDQYQDKQITPLQGAAADAHALADALVKYSGFDPEHVILLATDQPPERQPTKGNILVRLSNISTLIPKDGLLVFSFAGHGIERGGEAFLLSSDAKVSNDIRVVQETAVGAGHIKQWIRDMGIRQVVMLLDACRNDPTAGRSDTPNRMGESYRKAFSFDVRNHDVEAFATLYATRVGERAYLYAEKGHGYFTWALLEGLAGAAANPAGEVTLGSLERYVQETVPRLVKVDLGSSVDQRPFSEVGGYQAEELVLAKVTAAGRPETSGTVTSKVAEVEEWQRIAESRSVQAFTEFRQRYPGSNLALEATHRIEQLEWEKVKSTNDPKVLEAFLSDYPRGDYSAQATASLERLNVAVADRQEVLDLVARYADVFGRKDLEQIRVLWPTLTSRDARKFQEFFNIARAIQVSFQPETPQVRGDSASVDCVRTLRFSDERGSHEPTKDRVTLRMKRSNESWSIESIQ